MGLDPGAQQAWERRPRLVPPGRAGHPQHQVLLVDPDRELREALALYLQLHNVHVVATRSAEETLQRLRGGLRPCVVLTDPRAPGTAGWVLVDYLRTDSVLESVPLILCSDDPVQVQQAHRRGVSETIPRPAPPVAFMAAIERHCRRPQSSAAPVARRVRAATPLVTAASEPPSR